MKIQLTQRQSLAIIAAAPKGLRRTRAGWAAAGDALGLACHNFTVVHSLIDRGYLRQGQRPPIETRANLYLSESARDMLPAIIAQSEKVPA